MIICHLTHQGKTYAVSDRELAIHVSGDAHAAWLTEEFRERRLTITVFMQPD